MVRRKHRTKQHHNPLVEIDPEAVRAAMERREISPAELARRTGDHRQTIDALLRTEGEVRRCRKKRRERIAKALGVSERVLSGRLANMHNLIGQPGGFEFMAFPATYMAAERLVSRVEAAVKRDLREYPDEGIDRDAYPVADLEGGIVMEVVWAVTRLLQIGSWRNRLFEKSTLAFEERGGLKQAPSFVQWKLTNEGDEIGQEHQEAVVHLAGALEFVLLPWFEGRERLDYQSLFEVSRFGGTPLPRAVARERTSPWIMAELLAKTVWSLEEER